MVSMCTTTNLRKDLNADALFSDLHDKFKKVLDLRSGNKRVSLQGALMSGFAMFSLKCPSLLSFEEKNKTDGSNLKTIYGINDIPCDTQMRTILDDVNPEHLRPAFKTIFKHLQRGKVLEKFTSIDDHYLISLDGTQYFISEKIDRKSVV